MVLALKLCCQIVPALRPNIFEKVNSKSTTLFFDDYKTSDFDIPADGMKEDLTIFQEEGEDMKVQKITPLV